MCPKGDIKVFCSGCAVGTYGFVSPPDTQYAHGTMSWIVSVPQSHTGSGLYAACTNSFAASTVSAIATASPPVRSGQKSVQI